MKKIGALLVMLLLAGAVWAQSPPSPIARYCQLSATGFCPASTGVNILNQGVDTHNVYIVPIGTPGTITVLIQGSVKGDFTDAVTCGTSTTTSANLLSCSGIYSAVRVDVSVFTGFTSVNLSYVGTSSVAANGGKPVLFAGDPTGSACTATQLAVNESSGAVCGCSSGVYACAAGGTGCTVSGGTRGSLFNNASNGCSTSADFVFGGTGNHTLSGGASAVFDLHSASSFLLPGSLSTGLVTVTTSTGALSSVAAPAGAVVGTSDTQSLTNKSIVGSEINSGLVATARGGTNADSHASTGVARDDSGTWTWAEISGFATTSGSNALVPGHVGSGQTLTVDSGGTLTCSAGSTCPAGGSGTVTVVGSGSLTSTAIVTGGGSQALQTSSPTSTLSSGGNMALAGTLSATAVNVGASPATACGSAPSCYGFGSSATTGTPTASQSYIRGGSSLLTFSINGGSETTAWPINQGGTGTGSTLTGLVRGSASAMTAAELSSFAVTSGSNVTTPGHVVSGQTLTIDSGGTLTCAGGSTCPSGSGTVTSVTGTANQVDVATGTTTPVISLDSAINLPGSLTMAPAGGQTLTINNASSTGANSIVNYPYAPIYNTSDATDKLTSSGAQQYFSMNSGSAVIPANTIVAGKRFRITYMVDLVSGASTTNVVWNPVLCTVSGCGSGTVITIGKTVASGSGSLNNGTVRRTSSVSCIGTGVAGATATILCAQDPFFMSAGQDNATLTQSGIITNVPTNGALYVNLGVNQVSGSGNSVALLANWTNWDQ